MILFITGLVKGKLDSSAIFVWLFQIRVGEFNQLNYWMNETLGNGAGFIKILERLVRGVWTPTAFEFLQPSL